MFTILHISKEGDEPQTMYQSKKVMLWPASKAAGSSAWFEMETDHPTIHHILDEGTVIVMNDSGKTVAKHKLS